MNQTILQVPVDKKLKERAAKAASHQGFSSLQEIVRVFLNQLAKREVRLGFTYPAVELSPKNDERYATMVDEVLSGKVKTKKFKDTDSITDIMKYLNS